MQGRDPKLKFTRDRGAGGAIPIARTPRRRRRDAEPKAELGVDDLVVVVGGLAVAVGVGWWLAPAAGVIVLGLMLMAGGLLAGGLFRRGG